MARDIFRGVFRTLSPKFRLILLNIYTSYSHGFFSLNRSILGKILVKVVENTYTFGVQIFLPLASR